MLRSGFVCCLSILLLTACGDGPGAAGHDRGHPAEAYTWEAWVARERPLRPEHYEHHYHEERGLPNMSLWQPEDFLPEDYLAEPHADLCELPQEERKKVWRMPRNDGNHSVTFEEKLAYAAEGHAEAQASMSWYCYQHTNAAILEPGQLSLSEALEWSRRGAASGNPRAMYRHSECLQRMGLDTQIGRADHVLDPFWRDQAHYWLRRAATEGLHGHALLALRPTRGLNGYKYPTWEENALYNYQWSRLWELQAIFRRVPYYIGPRYLETNTELTRQREALSETELQQAEAMVGEWLRENSHVWDAIYRRPSNPSLSHITCPGEAGHTESFDYEGLNRELAQYGLNVEPPVDSQ